ncbi:MAG: L,D-transpeptidase [Pseudomonadota bacterium]
MRIEISISEQTLAVFDADESVLHHYTVSSAANGTGQQMDSYCTPLGLHVIEEKFGAGMPENTVFVGRSSTGEIYDISMRESEPDRDWILTRIIWLGGCESGYNKDGEVDTHSRYIYLHGCPDDVQMGIPGSKGCIRMRNKDIVELFKSVQVGTPVQINA